MLQITHPPGYRAERSYVFDVVLREFLGLEYRAVAGAPDVRISRAGDASGRELVLVDTLFQTPPALWLTAAALPQRPLLRWDTSTSVLHAPPATTTPAARPVPPAAPGPPPPGPTLVTPVLPVLYGRVLPGGALLATEPGRIHLGLDVFGSAFFMLTRYEEVVLCARDARERFPSWASLAGQESFLERPIVNEYVEVLWWCLQTLWPDLERRVRGGRLLLSHDVDAPLCGAGRSLSYVLARAAGDLWLRRDPALAWGRLRSYGLGCLGRTDGDLCNTFDLIMDLSEARGVRSAFNFIAGRTDPARDGVYSLDEPWIRRLLARIHQRGHEVGLHPSYGTFRRPDLIRQEFRTLQTAAAAAGVRQAAWGGRQHYLRWEAPTTWQAWADAGLDYDSTLGFADRAGFRSGTCYEYPVFNLHTRQALALRERPLVAMEGTLLDKKYLHLNPEQAAVAIKHLAQCCRRFGGDFALLWHNSSLVTAPAVALYRRVLSDL